MDSCGGATAAVCAEHIPAPSTMSGARNSTFESGEYCIYGVGSKYGLTKISLSKVSWES